MLFDAMPCAEEGESSTLRGDGLGLTPLAAAIFFPSYF